MHPSALPSITLKESELDIGEKDIKITTLQSLNSPSKYHDAEDPFYDKIRSRHPRSLNYNEK